MDNLNKRKYRIAAKIIGFMDKRQINNAAGIFNFLCNIPSPASVFKKIKKIIP